MKTKLVLLLSILLLFSIGLYAQKSKNKVYKVWVTKVDKSKIIKGLLYKANDDSLIIIDKHSKKIRIAASKIEKIKIRRKGKIGNGVLIGALTGLVTGGLIGLVSGDEPDETVDYGWPFGTITHEGEKASEKALLYGIPLAVVGSSVGAIIASKKNRITINGDIYKYKNNVEILKSFSMVISE